MVTWMTRFWVPIGSLTSPGSHLMLEYLYFWSWESSEILDPSQGLEKMDSGYWEEQQQQQQQSLVSVEWQWHGLWHRLKQKYYSHVLCIREFCQLLTCKHGVDRSYTTSLVEEGQSRTYGLTLINTSREKGHTQGWFWYFMELKKWLSPSSVKEM